jgi:hypothetical protein
MYAIVVSSRGHWTGTDPLRIQLTLVTSGKFDCALPISGNKFVPVIYIRIYLKLYY